MPKYENSITSLNLVALAILMNTNCYGYSTFLISQNREKISARISIISLVLNIALALVLAHVLNVRFSYVIMATMITYLYFSFAIVWEGNKLLGVQGFKVTMKNFFPVKLFIPYIVALMIGMLEIEYLIWIPLVLFVIINFSDLKSLVEMAKKLANNPNLADV